MDGLSEDDNFGAVSVAVCLCNSMASYIICEHCNSSTAAATALAHASPEIVLSASTRHLEQTLHLKQTLKLFPAYTQSIAQDLGVEVKKIQQDLSEGRLVRFSNGPVETKFIHNESKWRRNFLLTRNEVLVIARACHRTFQLSRDVVQQVYSGKLSLNDAQDLCGRSTLFRSNSPLTSVDRVLLALWQLTNNVKYHVISSMFSMSESAACNEVRHSLRVMYVSWGQQQLRWPTDDEKDLLLLNVVPVFPKCIGFVDGTETRWTGEDSATFSGKQGYHTLLHQITTTWYGRIIHVFTGEKGSSNDRGLFIRTTLFLNEHLFFREGEYLLADGGYEGEGPVRTPISSPDTAQLQLNGYISYHRASSETVHARIKQWFPFIGAKPKASFDVFVCAFLCACALVNFRCDFGTSRWLRDEKYLIACLAELECDEERVDLLKLLHLSRAHCSHTD